MPQRYLPKKATYRINNKEGGLSANVSLFATADFQSENFSDKTNFQYISISAISKPQHSPKTRSKIQMRQHSNSSKTIQLIAENAERILKENQKLTSKIHPTHNAALSSEQRYHLT